MNNKEFIVSQENWSLHRKGYEDQKRHSEKIKEVIKENLQEMITDESFITSDNKKITKFPIKSLNEYKIIYNYNKTQHVGQGDGNSQVGDTIATDNSSRTSKKKSNGAGSKPGEDYYEVDVDIMQVQKELFKDFKLPRLIKKQSGIISTDSYEFNDIRKIGLTGNIHKKRTMMSAFKRNAMKGKPGFHPIIPEDIRYKSWNESKKPDSKAVVLAMMDTSGSMGIWEKYMARSFFFWMVRFLKTQYEKVEIEFIAHHTEAKVVSEYNFFHRGDSGGTICSSAFRKALELIDKKYPPSQYNIYPIHFSDGDNLTSDNKRCINFINELMKVSNMVFYGEVNQYDRHSTLMSAYKNIHDEKFRYYILKQRDDVYNSLKYYLSE